MRCVVDNIAFGGDGVIRKDGLVIFTPFTLPQETIDLEITQKKSNFARGRLEKVIEPSPHRIPPPCQYFSTCGGCQLQHSSYPYQLELKKKFVEDSLLRIGKIAFSIPPVVPSSDPYFYRRHISLKIQKVKDLWQLCFSSLSGDPLPIYSCLLFQPLQDPTLSDLQGIVKQLSLPKGCEGRVKLLKEEKGHVVAFSFNQEISPKNLELLNSCEKLPTILQVTIQVPKKAVNPLSLSFDCNGLEVAYSPFSFLQNHEEQSSRIYMRILNLLEKSNKVLDLYCGIGISSLLLAKEGKDVVGVEINPTAINLAKQNATKNNLSKVKFLCSSVEQSITKQIVSINPDAVLVNPPKTGLDPAVQKALAHPSIKQLVYVSCHPPTLARDLSSLQSHGFTPKSIESFDMFPQTTHVETIAYLTR